MTTFLWRRIVHSGITATLLVALLVVHHLNSVSLHDTQFLTGWVLVGGIVGLACYNLRKKVPVLPLASAAGWLQVHIYAGWLTVAAFFLHTGLRLPRGPLEVALWTLFVLISLSGAVGLTLSRVLARRLGEHGERPIFERIPTLRADLARRVEDLALASARDTLSITIADYYRSELHDFFRRPRHRLAHLTGFRRHLRHLLDQIDSLNRYIDDRNRDTLAQIAACVVAKDNLDYHYALQGTLKLWLFVHLPLAYSVLPVAALHAVLAYAFAGISP
ncbi:MAG: hypothetical protein GC191_11265 [Azospirillum sp.]|nr:hypothetical protein [Azospirillum sp.]